MHREVRVRRVTLSRARANRLAVGVADDVQLVAGRILALEHVRQSSKRLVGALAELIRARIEGQVARESQHAELRVVRQQVRVTPGELGQGSVRRRVHEVQPAELVVESQEQLVVRSKLGPELGVFRAELLERALRAAAGVALQGQSALELLILTGERRIAVSRGPVLHLHLVVVLL